MTIRERVARGLRKWADLIDPRTGPSSRVTVSIDCDTSQFMRETDKAIDRAKALEDVMRAMRPFHGRGRYR